MKTVVILSMLVLALVAGAAARTDIKAELMKEEECKIHCLDEKLKEPACKEACALNQGFKTVWTGALQCSFDCQKKKPCEEECKKKYEAKVAELAGSCHEVCSKEEKEPAGVEKCKKICAPSLLYKQFQEKAAAEAKH